MIVLDQTNANIERHIKTHSVRSDDDRAAVSVLEIFLRSNGRINTSFASDDKWSNHDGTFKFVPDPDISRRPKQTFYVQIKGTRNYTERERKTKVCFDHLLLEKGIRKKPIIGLITGFFVWRRRRDSNPRPSGGIMISSHVRYDHFDTSPNIGDLPCLLYLFFVRLSSKITQICKF